MKLAAAFDMAKNEAQNFRAHILAAAPSSPVTGQLYYNSTDNTLYYWNGAWISAAGGTETLPVTIIDAKGDLILGTAADTAARQAVGADGTLLVAASGQSTGVQWRVLAATDIDELIATTDLTDWPRSAALDLNSQKLTGLAAATADTDAVNLGQLNAVSSGIDWKASVRAATTAAGTLATSFENTDVIDGVTLATGDRILIKDQAAGAENGIYTVNASGAPTRATDADVSAEVTGGMAAWVNEGTANADTAWTLTTNDAITLGTTALVFTQFGGLTSVTAGNALTKTGNTLDVAPGTGLEISADTIRIAAAAAGNGLTGGAGSALAVGAGTGITVAADTVSIDTAVVPGKFSVDIGDGAAVAYVVTHNLGTRDVVVSVRRTTTPWDVILADVEATSTTTVTVRFSTAPTSAQYRVTVVG